MGLTKQQLEALNVSSFPNNNAGAITPDILRQYNAATITNTVNQDTYTTDSASFDSRITAATGSTIYTGSFATTASFNAYTQSTNLFTASISTSVGLLQTFSGSQYKADSSSFDSRINAFASSSIPAGTVSSSAQIVAYNIFATTASVTASINTLSSSIYLTDATQSTNITNNSASAYQVNATQSFQITANALTASNATTALSQSLFFTDTTQSVNITQASASAWGAFQSASSYSASAYQVDVSQSQQISASFATSSANSASAYQVNATQSFQITANALTASNATTALSQSLYFTDTTQSANINSLTALTASTAYTNVNNSFSGTQSFVNVNVSGTASVAFLNVTYQSSSVIYSSGSNILGDEANIDTQTLVGRVIMTGSAEVTGSLKVSGDISSSTISGIGNVTLYSASVAASITGSSANVTALSQSLYFTDTTQSVNLTNLSSSIAQTDFTQSYQITANALTASTALTNYSSSQSTLNNTLSSSIATNSSSIGLLQTFSGSEYKNDSSSFDSRIIAATGSAIYTGSFATTGSNTFSGSQIINGNVNITGSLTASGLKYPTTDGTAGQFILTDGVGTLAFDDIHSLLEDVRYGEDITLGDPLYVNGSSGTRPIVFKADASNPAKMPVIYIAKSTGVTNTNTTALTLGLITGVTTTGYAAGTTIYVAEGGGWSSSRPSGSVSIVQPLGIVTKDGAGGSGRGLILNAGPAFLPNIQTGYTWVGNGSNQPTAVATSSFVNINQTGSFATTGSNTFVGNQSIEGNLYISSSNTSDIVVNGQVFISSSVSSSAGIAKLTISGSTAGSTGRAAQVVIVPTSITITRATTNGTQNASVGNGNISLTGPSSTITAAITTGSSIADISAVYAVGAIDNEVHLSADANGIYLQDWDNTTLSNSTWLTMGPNDGVTIPSPQFVRGLGVTGSAIFTELTGSLATFSASVNSRINAIPTINTSSFATTGSNSLTGSQIITGSLTITGSVATPPVALTISSNTASIDFSKGSIYTLTLVSGSNTYITASNITPGQTANLLVTQASVLSGSIVWASSFKFPTGSAYTGSKVANAVDLISFITVNNTTIYSVGAQNLV